MGSATDLRDFLTSRRARVTPDDVGLPAGANRRVTGLRREEVAVLAGISVEYYTRLERGSATGASDQVLESVARALRLDEAERSHLFNLVQAAQRSQPGGRSSERRPTPTRVRPSVQWVLDAITEAPAYIRNGRLDILAANPLGAALYAPILDDPEAKGNTARFMFLSDAAVDFFADWETIASNAVAILRAEAGRDPYDKRLTELIGELCTRSDEFASRWANHDVRFHRAGTKTLHHPVIGEVTLSYEAFDLPGDDGQRLMTYAPEPGSPAQEALRLLASWSTPDAASAATDALDG